jgi:hypothetical protein
LRVRTHSRIEFIIVFSQLPTEFRATNVTLRSTRSYHRRPVQKEESSVDKNCAVKLSMVDYPRPNLELADVLLIPPKKIRKKETLTAQQKDRPRTGFEPVPRCMRSLSHQAIFELYVHLFSCVLFVSTAELKAALCEAIHIMHQH